MAASQASRPAGRDASAVEAAPPEVGAADAGGWPGLAVRAGVPAPERIDLLVLDIDGVLLDCSRSYPYTISEAAQRYVAALGWRMDGLLLPPGETTLWKRAGGFNSDWALTQAALYFFMSKGRKAVSAARAAEPSQAAFLERVARAGGGLDAVRAIAGPAPPGWDPARIERLCCAVYAGDRCQAMFGFPAEGVSGPGLCEREVPLLAAERLLAFPGALGIYTGRNDGETAFALQRLGLAGRVPAARIITADSPYRKPDPGGLAAIARAAGEPRCAIFAGDNVDDLETVRRYRRLPAAGRPATAYLFAGVLGGALGEHAEEVFTAGGADLVAPGVADLVEALLRAPRGDPPNR
jgi:HAD superfamily hydrolase (TIGR01548 family)